MAKKKKSVAESYTSTADIKASVIPTGKIKRFRVYSVVNGGNRLLVGSFDLKSEAEQMMRRHELTYTRFSSRYGVIFPRLELVDGRKEEEDNAQGESADDREARAGADGEP